jgi:hypothetical protein
LETLVAELQNLSVSSPEWRTGKTHHPALDGFLPLVLDVAGSRVAVAREANRSPKERVEKCMVAIVDDGLIEK